MNLIGKMAGNMLLKGEGRELKSELQVINRKSF